MTRRTFSEKASLAGLVSLLFPFVPVMASAAGAPSPLQMPAIHAHLQQLKQDMRLGVSTPEQQALIDAYLQPSEILETSFRQDGYRLTFRNRKQHIIELSNTHGQRLTRVTSQRFHFPS